MTRFIFGLLLVTAGSISLVGCGETDDTAVIEDPTTVTTEGETVPATEPVVVEETTVEETTTPQE